MAARTSLLCPRCRRLVSADEAVCPYCGLRSPGSWWRRIGIGGAEGVLAWILYANVILYGLSLILGASRGGSGGLFSFLSPSDQSLFLLGATGTLPLRLHRWWSLLAANYLHGGLLHILFNMMALRQVGPLALREYGPSRFVVVYTLGGVLGFWISALAGVPFTIGASAAICAVIGAMLYYGKSRGGSYGQALYRQLGGWVVSLAIFGFLVPGINNWGHGGGLAAGAALGWLLGYQEQRREAPLHRTLAAACVALTLVALAWGVGSAVYLRLGTQG
ncbi:MAG: rhomboid family intramembrane serine protease [Deltaproteobacteria bacterium]|nr:rhomboid family intramembrane serine protease [Deltaproteobacteria bacterium]